MALCEGMEDLVDWQTLKGRKLMLV